MSYFDLFTAIAAFAESSCISWKYFKKAVFFVNGF